MKALRVAKQVQDLGPAGNAVRVRGPQVDPILPVLLRHRSAVTLPAENVRARDEAAQIASSLFEPSTINNPPSTATGCLPSFALMPRGNQQQPVFRDHRDLRLRLETLGEACQKRAPHCGPARQAQDEQAAAKWLGLEVLGLHPADLKGLIRDPPIK